MLIYAGVKQGLFDLVIESVTMWFVDYFMSEPGMEMENDWNVITHHFWLLFCNTQKLDAFISFRAILAVIIWWFKSYIFLSNPTLEQVLYINLKKKDCVILSLITLLMWDSA